jgi:hypothetical protein
MAVVVALEPLCHLIWSLEKVDKLVYLVPVVVGEAVGKRIVLLIGIKLSAMKEHEVYGVPAYAAILAALEGTVIV